MKTSSPTSLREFYRSNSVPKGVKRIRHCEEFTFLCLLMEAKDIHNLRRKMSKEQFEAPLKCLLELFLPFLIPL